jgi:hypothetical protein
VNPAHSRLPSPLSKGASLSLTEALTHTTNPHAHQVLFTFNEAMRLMGGEVAALPQYGVGHSLGAVIHLILGSRYAVQRASNVLLSVNSQELKDSVPLFR